MKIFLVAFLICTLQITYSQSKPVAPASTMKSFIDDLLKKMTIDEKIGQLTLFTSDMAVTGPTVREEYKKDITSGRCGSIFNAYTPAFTKQLQDMAMQTRLKIPLLFGYDVIHGHKTIFPIPLGEACSWDLAAMERSAQIAAKEAAADGLHWTYSPMVDIVRDPRWGRVAESSGEDPWLGAKIAQAKVRGYQGNGKPNNEQVLACVKHFALYGGAEAGRDYNTVDMSRRAMFETYLVPYKAAIDAGVATVMSSFNEIDGIPATGNKWLLTDLLRKQWGFKGFVVSDYTSINEMINHGVITNESEAGALALNAGLDMDMQGAIYSNHLKKLIAEKKVSMATLDASVRRVLEAKYILGLFQDPYKYVSEQRAQMNIFTAEHNTESFEAARRSIVLLKNDKVLPLHNNSSVALIGPLADNKKELIGNWSAAGDYKRAVSVRDAMVGSGSVRGIKVRYAKGANITDDPVLMQKLNNYGGELTKDSLNPQQLIEQAIAVAQQSDVVVAVLGESQGMSGEAASRSEIGIPSNQQVLLKALVATGKPVVLVLMNGRPLTLQWEQDNVAAIVETWFGGTQAGNAIRSVLYGEYNPSGKLTMTFPRSVGQIPIYYSAKNTGRPMDLNNKYSSKYLDIPNTPLYPFGYGLSYTTFQYSDISVDKNTLGKTGTVTVSVSVSNNGSYDGEEVVQMYIRDPVASVARPLKQLRGFKKINISKGATEKISFNLSVEDFKFYDKDMKWDYEAGDVFVYIGTNSSDVKEIKIRLVK
ncbi:MAG TPA: beta-glucosidase BglX [Flavitalea sp.]|nr:beta-glucosidase BglX [Flavitalea sp.]